jgi:putative two-component system response regulator
LILLRDSVEWYRFFNEYDIRPGGARPWRGYKARSEGASKQYAEEAEIMKKIFVVDDNDANLLSAKETLSVQYDIFTLPSASSMFELLTDIVPDLILLDIRMPEINGFDAIKLLKSKEPHADIPVIFLTNQNDSATEAQGFELGAVDFISKPFNETVLLKRVKTHLDIDGHIRERTEMLKTQVDRLQKLKNSMMSVLMEMLERNDKTTCGHIARTSAYMKLLINGMIERGVYADKIENWDMEMIVSSARLYDVGKSAVSDLIWSKPGKLTFEEFETMKTHAAEGERIIEKIILQTGDEEFLLNAKLFAGFHHERWDGAGYPHGLEGQEIPLQGRMMAIIDVYDALVTDRPYKSALTPDQAADIIMAGKGSQFDPDIVGVFFDIKDSFADVLDMLKYL